MYRILLVEDDEALRYVYAHMHAWQENGGCLAAQAVNGKQALEQLDKERFDIIVTDIRMPFVDGLELLRELRRRGIQTPVILVSSYGEFEYAREGLVLGAFDYIVKPFMPRELIARIQAVLRRYQFQSQTGEENQNVEVVCGPLTMNEASFEAKVDGEPLSLSAKEFKLLLVFAKNPERVYSREMLLSLVWDNAYVDERTVDVHMLRLRKQLQGTRAENLLQTVRGLGYRAHISE